MELIDKAAVVAEIERRKLNHIDLTEFNSGYKNAIFDILSFLNTLEVKEANSEFLKKYFEETPQEELDKEWKEIEPLNDIGPNVLELKMNNYGKTEKD